MLVVVIELFMFLQDYKWHHPVLWFSNDPKWTIRFDLYSASMIFVVKYIVM